MFPRPGSKSRSTSSAALRRAGLEVKTAVSAITATQAGVDGSWGQERQVTAGEEGELGGHKISVSVVFSRADGAADRPQQRFPI